ncbi:hypothetical protein [Actinoplanes sp. NPDC051494]|uniref:hypothetical protein n=1 Tax=Actinoplanes sp. NPDC051494 TaxID=3363907 RepID=UPI0037A56647
MSLREGVTVMAGEVVQQHVRLLLKAPFLAEEARRRRAEQIARTGRRVVVATGRELRDWLTGAVIAHHDPVRHYPADNLFTDVPEPDTLTPGIPPSLHRAIEEWVFDSSTPDREIADFVGWPVAKVREHR